MAEISCVQGNIVDQKTDAIVNAANKQLFGGSGVCGAIFDAAGYDVMTEACQKHGHCETGDAVITPGFKLPAKYVIHTVGPVYGDNENDAELLRSCYWQSLNLAEEKSLNSIAFPLISTGIYSYPKEEAVRIAVDSIRVFFDDNHASSIEQVILCAYNEEDAKLISKVLKKYQKSTPW